MISSNNNSILDTTSSRYIKLQIQYGSDLYELLLSSKDNKIRVENVLDEIEKIIKVPKCHQSIMYKGQRLDHKPKSNLDDLYIFNNSKLILTGTQKQYHDKYCCSDHDHHIITTTLTKSNSLQQQQQNNNTININEEKSKKNIDNSLKSKTQTSLIIPKKQEIYSNLIGFVPEPNKNYE
jgi:Mg2+/Co2+ transporter CorC